MVAISRERRRHTERMIRHQRIATDPLLSDDSRLAYAVSCLICSDVGHLSMAELAAGLRTPSVVAMAVRILIKCGAMPGSGVN